MWTGCGTGAVLWWVDEVFGFKEEDSVRLVRRRDWEGRTWDNVVRDVEGCVLLVGCLRWRRWT